MIFKNKLPFFDNYVAFLDLENWHKQSEANNSKYWGESSEQTVVTN
jgi:hypothetical protein